MPEIYVEQFNLMVEHLFAGRYSLMAGYSGQIGRHSSVRLNANQPNTKSSPSATMFDVRRYSYAGDVYGQYNVGYSNNNTFYTKFEARLNRGARAIVSYARSKSLDTSDGDRNVIENYYHPETTTLRQHGTGQTTSAQRSCIRCRSATGNTGWAAVILS